MISGWNVYEFFFRFQPVTYKDSDLSGIAVFTLECTLPDYGYTPPDILKGVNIPSVSCDIIVELLVPEIYVGSRCRGRFATVPVPKTAMDEQDRFEPRENDIRRPR